MAINKTWVEGTFARASVAYNLRGEKRGRHAPRYEWTRVPGPRWQDLFDTDQIAAQYTSGGDTAATWAVSGGKLSGTGGDQATLVKNSLSLQDIEIEINSDQAHDGGIIARQQDNNNYYLLQVGDDSGVDPLTNLQIYKRVGGTFTRLVTADVTWPRGTSKLIKFVLNGSKLEVYFDGSKVISITDTSITATGSMGFRNNSVTAFQVLDFKVYQAVQGILVEKGTTNVLLYSEQFDNAAWVKTNATVTPNTTIAPDGTTTADTLTDSSIEQLVTIPGTAVPWEFSVCVKKDTITTRFPEFVLRLYSTGPSAFENYVQLNTNTGAIISRFSVGTVDASVADMGDYWRISIMVTNVDQTTAIIRIRPAFSSTLGGGFDVTVTGSIVVWGAQLEQKAYATTYMATTSVAATRSAETLTLPTAGVFKKRNWAVKMTFTPTSKQDNGLLNHLWYYSIDGSNEYMIRTTPDGYLQGAVWSGAAGVYITDSVVLQLNTPYSIMLSGNGTNARLCKNGTQIAVDTTYAEPIGSLPANIYIGSNPFGTEQANGIISDVEIGYAETLAEDQADYATGKPAAFDAKTAAIMPFAGNLKAYTRRMTVETDSLGAWVLQPIGGTILEGSNLPIAPGFRKYSEQADQVHGDIDFGGVLDQQEYDFIIDVRKSNAEKFNYIHQLAYWSDPRAGFQEFSWDDDPIARCLLIRRTGQLSYANKYNALKFRLPVEAKSFWESVETHELWMNNSSGDAENGGNEEAPVVITFYDACTNPSITINGVSVSYTGSLVDGDRLIIDTRAMTAKKIDSGGTTTNVLGNMGANWPKLQPGLNYVTTTFFASLQWRDRWI